VVSLAAPVQPEHSARHISPQEFHSMLQSASAASSSTAAAAAAAAAATEAAQQPPVVLLDARNVYESAIGRFSADNCEVLLPSTRQFSDLPKWIDSHLDQLAGRRVMMYCTGGVRLALISPNARYCFARVHAM
jgi:predicted sulfurtransferase